MSEDYLEIGGQKEDNLVLSAKGGATAFVLKISATALGFLNQIILARILGAGGVGEVLLALSVINITAQLARFGMEGAMMRFIPLYIEKRDKARLNGTIYFVLKFCSLLSIFFVFLVLLFSKFISIDVFHSDGLLKLLPIIAISLPASVIRGVIGGVLKGYNDALKALLPEFFILPFFRVMIFLLLSLQGASPLYAVVAFILGEVFAMILSIIFLFKKIDKIKTLEHKSEYKKVFNLASTMILTGFSAFLFTEADIWIVGMFTSIEAVGIYGVTVKLVALVIFSLGALSNVIPPLMSSVHASGDRNELRRVVSESTRWILSMSIPIILILILEGNFILKYLFGEKFANGYTALLILSIGQLINAGSGLVGYLLQMTGGHKILMKINIFWGILNVILNIILVPRLGIIGAALSTAFCLAMVNIVSVIVVYNRLSVLTLAKGLKFDFVFIAVVAFLYLICRYMNFYMGYHLLLISSIIVYIWKSIANDDLPWRLLLAKTKPYESTAYLRRRKYDK